MDLLPAWLHSFFEHQRTHVNRNRTTQKGAEGPEHNIKACAAISGLFLSIIYSLYRLSILYVYVPTEGRHRKNEGELPFHSEFTRASRPNFARKGLKDLLISAWKGSYLDRKILLKCVLWYDNTSASNGFCTCICIILHFFKNQNSHFIYELNTRFGLEKHQRTLDSLQEIMFSFPYISVYYYLL